MAFGQFKLQTAAISAHLTIGLADAAVKSLEVFAGERGRGETRPASYDELLAISDGKTIKSAPQALQDKADEVRDGATEIAMAAARSARFLELKDMSEEQRARTVRKEAMAIENGVDISNPTRAQSRMLAIETERGETTSEKKARFMRQMRRGHELIREGPDQDTRTQLNRSHARRVAEQHRLSAVQG